MADLLNMDLLPKGSGEKISRFSRSLWSHAPSQALRLYSGLALAMTLGIVPLNSRFSKPLSLSLTLISCVSTAMIAKELEELQADLDEGAAIKNNRRDNRVAGIQLLDSTRAYTEATQRRLEVASALPAFAREVDLIETSPAALPAASKNSAFEKALGLPAGTTTTLQKTKTEPTPAAPAAPLSGPYYGPLPVVDIAQKMAEEVRSVLGTGSTGCGKTTLITNAIVAQAKLNEASDFTAFGHKTSSNGTAPFAGLEDTEDTLYLTATMQGDKLLTAARKFESRVRLLTRLIETKAEVPTVIVVDQSNQGIKACGNAFKAARTERKNMNNLAAPGEKDMSEIPFTNLQHEYQNLLVSGVVDGREKNVKVWNLGHSNTNEALGMDNQSKNNVCYVGLGRRGNWASVTSLLKDDRFVHRQDERDRLRDELKEFFAYHQSQGSPENVVLAITNLGSDHFYLCVIPKYRSDVKAQFSPITNPPLVDDEPELSADAEPMEVSDEPKDIRRGDAIASLNRLWSVDAPEPEPMISREQKLDAILLSLESKQANGLYTLKQFLDGSRVLRSRFKVSTDFLREILVLLQEQGVVTLTDDQQSFTYHGGL